MSFSFFITRRFTLSRKESRFINLISIIAISGIALGVATLVIALSILNGFENTLTQKIMDFDSHIRISSFRSYLPDYHAVMPVIKNELLPEGTEVNPYASSIAIISSRKVQEGVSIKGIIPENTSLRIKNNIVEGEFELRSDSLVKQIIIGKKLANKLRIKLHDKVTVFALANNKAPSLENMPNIQKFIVSGIFESGMAEYDDIYAYVNLNSAQELSNIGDNVTGYDVKVKDITKIDSLTAYLNKNLRYPHYARSIYQEHRNIFTWIDLQKKPIPIVLGLIIIVAVFNIVGTLLMIVLEKTTSIGILKSIGAKRKQIIKIFVYQGIFLGVIGIVLGDLLALILTYIQLEYQIIPIPASVYFMSSIPVLIKPFDFILISLLTFIMCIIAALIPSYIASKITPISSLRFN